MKKGIKNFLDFLKEIESLFRLIEVIFVVIATVFVSTKANSIAEMELSVEKASIQPQFEVVENIENGISGGENTNSVLTISNLDGQCENVDIKVICIIEFTYFDETDFIKKYFKLEDFYYGYFWGGSNNGKICEIKNEDNWKKYCDFSKRVLFSKKIECGYVDLNKYVRISYEDQLGEEHELYFEVNSINSRMLNLEEGIKIFKDYNDIKDKISVDDLQIDNLLKDTL